MSEFQLILHVPRPIAPLTGGIAAQIARLMDKVALMLAGVGADWLHRVQCCYQLTEFKRDFATFGDLYRRCFPLDRRYLRTTAAVTALDLDVLVERVCVARQPKSETA